MSLRVQPLRCRRTRDYGIESPFSAARRATPTLDPTLDPALDPALSG